MEKIPPYLVDYIISFVRPIREEKQKELSGLDREIEKLQKSPKVTGMMFYKMDDYTNKHYKRKWKWQL